MDIFSDDFCDFLYNKCEPLFKNIEKKSNWLKVNQDFDNLYKNIFAFLPKEKQDILFDLFSLSDEKQLIKNAFYYKCGFVDGIVARQETLDNEKD